MTVYLLMFFKFPKCTSHFTTVMPHQLCDQGVSPLNQSRALNNHLSSHPSLCFQNPTVINCQQHWNCLISISLSPWQRVLKEYYLVTVWRYLVFWWRHHQQSAPSICVVRHLQKISCRCAVSHISLQQGEWSSIVFYLLCQPKIIHPLVSEHRHLTNSYRLDGI